MAKFLSKNGKFYMRNGKLLRYSATLEGTWVFNNTLTTWPTSLNNTSINVRCVSNGSPFENFDFVNGDSSSINYGTTTVKTTSWSDAAYRIVTFAFPFDGTDNLVFYDWFVTNAIKSDCLNWKLNPNIRCSTTTTYPGGTNTSSKTIASNTCTPNLSGSFMIDEIPYVNISVTGDYGRYSSGSNNRYELCSTTTMKLITTNSSNSKTLTIGQGYNYARTYLNASSPIGAYYPAGYTFCDVTTSEQVLTFTAIPTGAMLTWLLDNAIPQAEVPVSKTWMINETPDLTNDMYVHINFTSRGISYKQFAIESSKLYYDNSPVCDDIGFVKEAFRTVVFETAPTGELLTWLQANAVPQ